MAAARPLLGTAPPRLPTALFLAAVSSAKLPICSGDGMFPFPPPLPLWPWPLRPLLPPLFPPPPYLGIAADAWRAVAVLSAASISICQPGRACGEGVAWVGWGRGEVGGGCGPAPRSLPVAVFHRCSGKRRSRLVLLLSSSPSPRLPPRRSAASRCRESRISPPALHPGGWGLLPRPPPSPGVPRRGHVRLHQLLQKPLHLLHAHFAWWGDSSGG